MNEITQYVNENFGTLRTTIINGEPWFVAADVCRALDINNARMATDRLDDDEKAAVSLTDTSSNGVTQRREMTAVSETGLYSLVLGSRKPEAKAFKRRITHEVVPAIRKHGMYATPDTIANALKDPNSLVQILKVLEEEQNARLEAEEKQRIAEEKNRINAPKVLFADSVSQSQSEILIGELAKLLKQNGIATGQNRLYDQLRRDGYIMYNSTMPTQKAMELGLFRIIERTVAQPNGPTIVTKTTKVTGKGQIYFVNKYATKIEIE